MPHNLLQDRVTIITGAGQGLGRAVALEFALEGASVALLELNDDKLEQTAQEITEQGGECKSFALDITDYDAYGRVVDEVMDWKGKIDILVNNAAIAIYGTILDDSLENWRTTNRGQPRSCLHVGSKLVAHRTWSKRATAGSSASPRFKALPLAEKPGPYNAAKGGIIAYTKSMAVELGRSRHILVNAVAPGFMRTPMSFVDGVDETTTPEFMDWYVDRGKIPLTSHRTAGRCFRHNRVPWFGILPLYDRSVVGG